MFKKILHGVLLLGLLVSCKPNEAPSDIEATIHKVETSLSPLVHLVGDSVWTIERRMEHYGVPGVSIAVIYNNKIAWSKAYGIMDKETKVPVTTQTLFQAGSISKPVAAYGALKFVELGKINADENVNKYLKSWQLPDNEFTKEKKVHVKHLLSHSGGVTVHGFLGYSPDLPVPALVQVLDGEVPANSPPIRIDKVPGESFRYSGGGYTIMQQMLIDIDGKPFPEMMQENVLGPLGMSSSTYSQPLPPERIVFAATGYVPDGTMTKGKRHTYPEMAAAGLWTTAEDLARFAIDVQLSLKGKSNKVLSQAMVNQMLTPYASKDVGLGIFIDTHKEDTYFGHGGWDEGFSSELTAHKNKGYGVVVLINSNHPPFIAELIRSVALTYQWGDYVKTYQPLPLDSNSIKSIIGRYRYESDGAVNVYKQGNRLFYKHVRFEPMEMFRISDSTFIRHEREARIQFKANPADGKLHLVFLMEGEDSIKFEHPLMTAEEKVPYEWFAEGNYTQALKAYQQLVKTKADDPAIREGEINNSGYELMRNGKVSMAKEMFKINMTLYPQSANVYDSYAEACMKNGDTKEAILNYKKTLALKPDNPAAKKNLAELMAK